MDPKIIPVKTSNPPVLILRKQEYPVEPGIPLKEALIFVGLEPELYIAVRDGSLLQPEDMLQPGDRVKLIAVIAGG